MVFMQYLERFVSLSQPRAGSSARAGSSRTHALSDDDCALMKKLREFYSNLAGFANPVPIATSYDTATDQYIILPYDEALCIVDLAPPKRIGNSPGVATSISSAAAPSDTALCAMAVDMVAILSPRMIEHDCTRPEADERVYRQILGYREVAQNAADAQRAAELSASEPFLAPAPDDDDAPPPSPLSD